jgi:biopolymer transport protein ExbD
VKPRQHGRRRRAHLESESELNITAFLNLMVVLLPFLLTTAVFSRLAVIGVDVPTPGPRAEVPPPPPPKPAYTLALRLEADAVVVRAGDAAPVSVPRGADGAYDAAYLSRVLAGVKAAHPEHDTVDLYARPDTPYAELVAVMDAASLGPEGNPLFADVRLGELRP